MSVAVKKFGEGLVSNSLSALATLGASEEGVRMSALFHYDKNNGSSPVEVRLALNFSGTDRFIYQTTLLPGETAAGYLGPLPSNAVVKAVASAASTIEFTLTGGSIS